VQSPPSGRELHRPQLPVPRNDWEATRATQATRPDGCASGGSVGFALPARVGGGPSNSATRTVEAPVAPAARAGREDDGVRLDFTEHAGEDCGSAHAHPVLRGSADLSTCHRPAHATWKRNVRPPSSPTSCSGSFGQMVASQPSHSLCPVPWPTPDVFGLSSLSGLAGQRGRAERAHRRSQKPPTKSSLYHEPLLRSQIALSSS